MRSLAKNAALCCLMLALIAAARQTGRADTAPQALGLWPRGTQAYLAAGQSMPLWPQLPAAASAPRKDRVLTITFPAGFTITSWGKSRAFAVQPKPLVVPSSVQKIRNDAKNAVYQLTIPAADLPAGNEAGRLALMVNPGQNPPGQYNALLALNGMNEPVQVLLTVLEPLRGKRPGRLQIGVYNYNGLSDAAWLKDMDAAVLNSGINLIWDMAPVQAAQRGDSLAARLAPQGVDGGVLWFWKKFAATLGKSFPEAVRLGASGKPDPAGGIASSWVIEHRDEVMPLLEESLKSTLESGIYHSLALDYEERAINRDGRTAAGDVYNPGVMEAFAKFAGLGQAPPADPAFIAQHYAAQWTDYRTWQSAQLSAMAADALQQVNPLVSYGLYSGYEYAPPLEGSTRRLYSVDWRKISKDGKVQFGQAGYDGSPADLQNTALALGDHPYIPAEMYLQNFAASAQTLPDPRRFAFRLLSAALNGGGRGGVSIWYLSVLDAGAYSAIAKVSGVLADAEPFLLDGKRADSLLDLPRGIDPTNVFAYQLGRRRLVIALNGSTQDMSFRAAWKDKISAPDTTELVSGQKLGNAPYLEATLKPDEFAAFLTFSDGN